MLTPTLTYIQKDREGRWEAGHTALRARMACSPNLSPRTVLPGLRAGGEYRDRLKSLLPLLQIQQMPAPRWHLEMPGESGHGEHATGLWNCGSIVKDKRTAFPEHWVGHLQEEVWLRGDPGQWGWGSFCLLSTEALSPWQRLRAQLSCHCHLQRHF